MTGNSQKVKYVLELISKLTFDWGVQSYINLCKIYLHGVSYGIKKMPKYHKNDFPLCFLCLIFFLRLEMSTKNPIQITESPPPWIFGPFYGSAVPTRLCLLVLV